ncbi:mitochondrial ribosomal protein L31-domain-containing protein [Pyronema domesticum]|nr:mitochondrial ribosomal protein L31-domain-containing protein [Pyronema domesticum]
MFGALRPSQPLFGGLLWKIPWRMSTPQKYRQRQRLRRVDRIVDCLENALAKTGTKIAAIDRWRAEMPTEAEMEPKDKYTIFDRNARKYRKGIHKVPKWTRVSQRVNPPGF